MTPSPFAGRGSAEGDFVLRALDAAARVLRTVGRSRPSVRKADRTPVTAVDLAVQAVLAKLLEEDFPNDVLVGEESGEMLRSSNADRILADTLEAVRQVRLDADLDRLLTWLDRGRGEPGRRFWTLDPVDGTKGLLRGGQFVTALALIEDGQVVLAGLACPRYPADTTNGSFAVALRGTGAWAAPTIDGPWTPLAVSDEADPAHARQLRSVESPYATYRALGAIRRALRINGPELKMDSQVKYLALAAGAGDFLIRLPRKRGALRENIWDHASGVLLVEEAGGRCTDVLGRPLDLAAARQMIHNLGVVGSNGRLHEAVLEAIRSAVPPEALGAKV
jgi:3'(2'), 5'-bisphosphate nucleotidase